MIASIVLAWSLATTCPLINTYRQQGYSDAQIESYAREHHVPEWMISLAKRHCSR